MKTWPDEVARCGGAARPGSLLEHRHIKTLLRDDRRKSTDYDAAKSNADAQKKKVQEAAVNLSRARSFSAETICAEEFRDHLQRSLLLDFPGFSAMAADLLDYLVTEGVFQRHTYVNGGRANPNGENPSFITTQRLTKEQMEHEVIVLIVEALEALLALEVKGVFVNVHDGDYRKQLTFTQLLHGDYSGSTFRVVVFFSPEGSVRYFQVVDSDGTVIFEHHVTNLSLAAVGMKGAARQTGLYGNCHGCVGIKGPSATLVVTFNVRCALPTMPSPPFVSRNQSTPLHQSPSQSPSLEHRDRPAAAGRAHRSKWVRCRVRSAKPPSVNSIAIRWFWRR